MADMQSMIQQLRQLALQHDNGSEDRPADQTDENNGEQLISEFMAKMNLSTATPSQDSDGTTGYDNESDSESSDLDVDPSHTFHDLYFFALRLNEAARSTHILAANMRNWFHQNSLPEHWSVAKKICDALCLRRLEVGVLENHAADQCSVTRDGPDTTREEKKRLRQLFMEAEDGLKSLGAVEVDLIAVFNICRAGVEGKGWNNHEWDDILEELVRIQQGGKGEKMEWMWGWTSLPCMD